MSRSALSIVEERYGSLEELAYLILDAENHPALDETLPLSARAESVGLPVTVFGRILQDPAFKHMLRANLVNRAYTLAEEEAHIKHMVKVAVNEERKVVTNKGTIEYVDQTPTDVISAGKYLNELRGTPIEQRRESQFQGVVVNIENVQVSFGERDSTVTLEASVHTPRRAGDLPSASVPAGAVPAAQRPALPGAGADGLLGDLYGDGAKEAAEADALARREPPKEEPQEVGPRRYRSLWPGQARRKEARIISLPQRPPYED